MSEEFEVLREVCKKLGEAKIAYMITGSVAANFYAVPRMTRDVDIVMELKQADTKKIASLFKDKFYVDLESIQEAVAKEGMFNIIHNEYIFKIDFMIRKNKPYRETEFKRRRQIEIGGVKMWIVSPEDLILSKLFWAKDSFSELQLKDVKNLFGTVENLDIHYIKKWIEPLGLKEIYNEFKNG